MHAGKVKKEFRPEKSGVERAKHAKHKKVVPK